MEQSTTHLPPWLQRALRAPCPIRVEFPDAGYVSVFPRQGRYASNIQDWATPSLLESDAAEFTPLLDSTAGQGGQPLDQLHWTLSLQRLQRQAQPFTFQLSMVRLVSWPSLTHLPEDVLPAVARICALLARKPTAAALIPLTLGLPEAQVFLLIEALRLQGHVQVSGAEPRAEGAINPAVQQVHASAAVEPAERPAGPSLIGKLWQRLVARP